MLRPSRLLIPVFPGISVVCSQSRRDRVPGLWHDLASLTSVKLGAFQLDGDDFGRVDGCCED